MTQRFMDIGLLGKSAINGSIHDTFVIQTLQDVGRYKMIEALLFFD